MAKLFASLLSTLYWPVIGFFALAAVVFAVAFVATIERSATHSYYNTGSLKTVAFVVAMLTASIVLKQRGDTRMAHLVLFVPFGLVLVSVILFFLLAYGLGKGK